MYYSLAPWKTVTVVRTISKTERLSLVEAEQLPKVPQQIHKGDGPGTHVLWFSEDPVSARHQKLHKEALSCALDNKAPVAALSTAECAYPRARHRGAQHLSKERMNERMSEM